MKSEKEGKTNNIKASPTNKFSFGSKNFLPVIELTNDQNEQSFIAKNYQENDNNCEIKSKNSLKSDNLED